MQVGIRVGGISPPVRLHAINTKTIDGLERAAKERVLYVPKKDGSFVPAPLPKPKHFENMLRKSVCILTSFLPSTAPMSYATFLATTKSCKRKIVKNAIDGLLATPLSDRDFGIELFGKYEKGNFTAKKNPAMRMISYRGARYCVEYGRFIRPIEHHILHKSLDRLFGEPTVFKGMNALNSGRAMRRKWNTFTHPVAVGIDAVKYDQHIHSDALRMVHSIYAACFPLKKFKSKLKWLCRAQLVNTCKAYTEDGKLKYIVEGQTMSGEMSTSLTACLIMCLMLHTYARVKGIRISLANNGDDCVVLMEAVDEPAFRDGFDHWFIQMGFEMTVEPTVSIFEKISFCQTQPIYIGPGPIDYIMCRDPFTGIAKDTVMIDRWTTPKMFKAWLYAVGQGGLSLTKNLPIFPSFYNSYLRAGKFDSKYSERKALTWAQRTMLKNLELREGGPTPETRASFYYAFDVTPDEQYVLEQFYDSCTITSTLQEYSKFTFQPPQPLGCLDPGECPWEKYSDSQNILRHDRMTIDMFRTREG
jgi:hypothetical protein